MKGGGWGRSLGLVLLRIGAVLCLGLVVLPPVQVLLARFVHPPLTSPMRQAVWASWMDGDPALQREVVPLAQAGHFARAVIASEDAAFYYHYGVDFGGLCDAMGRNASAGRVVAGGSTITQQTAKNAFLWLDRSYVRKGLELVYTVWLTALLPKERVLELYVNLVELGPGIFGVEAAAQHYFGVSAGKLSREQAARLAAILPSPKTRDPRGEYAGKRARAILAQWPPLPGDKGFDAVGEAWRKRSLQRCGL